MKLVAGIDGGQSSTTLVLGGEDARELARVSGAPIDFVGHADDSPQRARILNELIDRALLAAGLAADTILDSVVAGVSGHDDAEPGPPYPVERARLWRVVHDSEIARVAALGDAPGIVVIAGTGSAAFGIDEIGGRIMAGGWGYLLGDEGSAFWLARTAVARAMTAFDHGKPDVLGDLACEHFGCTSLRALQQALGRGDIDRARFASFAGPILVIADSIPDAALLRDEGAAALRTLVRSVDERLAPSSHRRVSWIGGMFEDEGFLAAFIRACERVPRLRVAPPKHDPATAALLLAAREVSA